MGDTVKMSKRSNNRQEGFTLIELMVVVAIIGILAAIGVPQMTKFIKNAETAEPISQAGFISQAVRGYYDAHPQVAVATLTTAVNGKKVQKTGGGLSDVIPEIAVSGDHIWIYTVNVATDTNDVPHVCILAEKEGNLGVFVYFSDRRSAKAEWSNNAFTATYVAGATLVVGGSCGAAGAASATDQG